MLNRRGAQGIGASVSPGHLTAGPVGRLTGLGYLGLQSIDDLRARLDKDGVELVVDVRMSPASRRPLWGRETRSTVQATGRRYSWMPGLGNRLYRSTGIEIADLDEIETVLDELRAGVNVALMCACQDPSECHRSVLIEEAVRREPGLRVAMAPAISTRLSPRRRPGNGGTSSR